MIDLSIVLSICDRPTSLSLVSLVQAGRFQTARIEAPTVSSGSKRLEQHAHGPHGHVTRAGDSSTGAATMTSIV